MGQCVSPGQVIDSFIANTPLISTTIDDMTLQAPSWFRDMLNPTPWPEGEGLSMQKFTYHGELPEVEEGFDSWQLLDDPSGCGEICAPNCDYNLHALKGNAFKQKTFRLMKKGFQSADYCVDKISTLRSYQEVFSATIKHFYNQINFHKEVNVGQNHMTATSFKYMIDGVGLKPNPEDPFAYRPKGSTTLAALTIGILESLYQVIRMVPEVLPMSYSNNMPLYALVASPETISELFRGDPTIRADLRAAAGGNSQYGMDLIQRYAFNYTIRDMFLPVQYLTPRRFRWTGTEWKRVLPWVNGVKGTVGTFSSVNPQYANPAYATHEEVLIHGRDPLSIMYKTVPDTLGEGTSFGPRPRGFWDMFQWWNEPTRQDPGAKVGFFWTETEISLQNNTDIYAIMVPRKPVYSSILYYPEGPVNCPPTSEDCTNVLADVGCPTGQITSFIAHPTLAGNYFVTFSTAVDAEALDVILLESTSSGFVSATVVDASGDEISSDGKTFWVTIPGTVPVCDRFYRVFDVTTLNCSAKVDRYEIDSADATRLYLQLDLPVRAYTASNVVTLTYGNGVTQSATIVTANMLTNVWHVDIGATAFADNVNGIVEICVPTATVASCPGCTVGPTETVCTEA